MDFRLSDEQRQMIEAARKVGDHFGLEYWRKQDAAKQFPKEKIYTHGANVSYTFESILIAADAFKRARTTAPKELAEAIRQTNITDRVSLGGPIKFNAKGQVEGNLSACLQNRDGAPRVVLPAGAAEAKPVFPWPDYKA